MKKVTLYVSGTHCNACKIFIEDVLNEQIGITNASVDLDKETVFFESSLSDSDEKLAEMLTEKIKNNGYTLSVQKKVPIKTEGGDIRKALPIGLIFLAGFFLLQKSGILNFGFGQELTPITSFIIGLVASVSSCLAIVGGLVLSLSATVSKNSFDEKKQIILFQGGRLFGFAILGGVLGAVGEVIGVNSTVSAILGLLASTIMILLGLNLVGIFKKALISLPPVIFNFFRRSKQKTVAPLLIGVGTFFLPCGFTQAMQVAALSSGTFTSGLFIMGSFALGTLPMLALLSFGSISLSKSKYAPLFFKSAGVVVIGLGGFALLAGLAGLGIIDPLFNI